MRYSLALLSVLTSLALAAPAFADLPPPNSEGCDGKKAGDACKNDAAKDATCADKKCTVLDYSDGSPPGTKEVDCLLCEGPAAAGSSSGGDGDGNDSGGCGFRVPGRAALGAAGAWAAGAAILLIFRRSAARRQSRRR
jgi:hypothetical protein